MADESGFQPVATRQASRKLWRITSKAPRETLAICWYTITVFMVLSAVRSNNPVSVVLCLIPTPITLLFGVAELWRALTEETSDGV